MSVTGGLKAAPAEVASAELAKAEVAKAEVAKSELAKSWPRRFLVNMGWGFATILRPPRRMTTPAWREHRRLAVGALAVTFATAASMLLLDRSIAEAVRHLPPWLAATF